MEEANITCQNCGAENSPDAAVCAHCGTEVAAVAQQAVDVSPALPMDAQAAQAMPPDYVPPPEGTGQPQSQFTVAAQVGYQAAPAQPYQQAGLQYVAYPVQKTDGLCVASLVTGILAWFTPFVGLLLAVLAVIFGAVGIKKVNQNPTILRGKGMGIAGMVLGIVGLALSLILVLLIIGIVGSA